MTRLLIATALAVALCLGWVALGGWRRRVEPVGAWVEPYGDDGMFV